MKKQLLLLVMMLLPMVAMADAVEIDGIYYNLITKGKIAEVTSSPNYYSGSVAIPEKVQHEGTEYSVTRIAEGAFCDCWELTSITIPNSVTSIGNSAFSWCSSLQKVIVKDIAAWCGISFSDPGSNPLCYAHHFYSDENTEITELIIPNSVTSIGNMAFSGCSALTSITIPNSVTSIGNYAFDNCSGLTSITIPNSVTSIGGGAFRSCSGLTSITIPNSVTSIGESAFYGCSGLTSITIPNSVTSIGYQAFYQCSDLTSITIGGGVKTISSRAFANCPELTDVTCYAENEPTTQSDAFANSYIEYATLHVPNSSIELYKAAEPWKNFKAIVGIKGDGTLDNPFSPSEASEYVQTLEVGVPSDKDFYISGKISSIKNEFTTRYGNATFNISENGRSDETQFLIYRTLYLGNREFVEGDENIKVGDEVVVCGKVINYNGTTPETYEKTSYLYSLNGTLPKCATPVITLEGNKLKFSCDTEGVTYHYDITLNGSLSGTGDEMEIPNSISYPVTVYASKAGYQNSDVAYMDLPRSVSLKGDVNTDGEVNVGDIVTVTNIMAGKDE